jgi:short-subunit dehydrogenase
MVTGASSGIGRSFARQLAERGTDLVVVARRADRLEQLAAELADRHGVRVEVLPHDLAVEKDLDQVVERLRDPARPIDLLVNNAGFGTTGVFAELPVERELEEIAVNVVAPIRLTRAALPGMLARGIGGVLAVSSMVGAMPMPRSATYGASKAFASAFNESLFVEVQGRGVTVTTVLAGLTRTEFHEAAGASIDGIPKLAWLEPDQVAGAGLAGLLAGRPTVVPGVMNRMQMPWLRIAPRGLMRAVVKRMWKA